VARDGPARRLISVMPEAALICNQLTIRRRGELKWQSMAWLVGHPPAIRRTKAHIGVNLIWRRMTTRRGGDEEMLPGSQASHLSLDAVARVISRRLMPVVALVVNLRRSPPRGQRWSWGPGGAFGTVPHETVTLNDLVTVVIPSLTVT
jgi:hypothetical protein